MRGHIGDTIEAEEKLVVIHHGDTFTTGPTAAAYVVTDLVRPNAELTSHANEAATEHGAVITGTRTAILIAASRMHVHVPPSGVTLSLDATANRVSGCR